MVQVVVAKALEFGPRGPHPHQQGVVNEPIGEHQAVAIRQGADGRQIGLEAAGEEQHPCSTEPCRQGLLQLGVPRPAARYQPGGSSPHAGFGSGHLGGGHQRGVVA